MITAAAADPAGTLTTLLSVIGAVGTLAGAVVVPIVIVRMRRRVDTATAVQAEAVAAKTTEEAKGVAISNTERLIQLYQAQQEREMRHADKQQAAKDQELAEHRAHSDERIHSLEKEVAGLQDTQRAFTGALIPHIGWDGRAFMYARVADEAFPPPPPFGFDGLPVVSAPPATTHP